MALAVSTAAFLAFGQMVLFVAVVIVIIWAVQRPGRYVTTPP